MAEKVAKGGAKGWRKSSRRRSSTSGSAEGAAASTIAAACQLTINMSLARMMVLKSRWVWILAGVKQLRRGTEKMTCGYWAWTLDFFLEWLKCINSAR
jgi:hypothetical protein